MSATGGGARGTGPVSENLQFLDDLPARGAALFDSIPALGIAKQDHITYQKLDELVTRKAAWLQRHGVSARSRVALLAENAPLWAVSYFAAIRAGAVMVPILPGFSEDDVANILSESGSVLLLASDRLMEKGRVACARAGIPCVSQEEALAETERADHGEGAGFQAVSDRSPDDLAVLIYTSGTTGASKGVMLSHTNILSNAAAAAPLANILPGESLLSVLPLAHTYECTIGLVAPLLTGASVYYPHKPISPSVLVDVLKTVRPHIMLSVPVLIEKLYRSKILPSLTRSPLIRTAMRVTPVRKLVHRLAGKKLAAVFGGRLRFFGIGGAPLAPDVEQFLFEARFPYAVGYGLTETAPLLAGCGTSGVKPGYIGPVLSGVSIRIARAHESDETGEIQARGPNVMLGYYGDKARTREVFTEDGWFCTGDLGTFDAEGNLAIRGRLKTVILGPNGENIYPEVIEAVINRERFVAESLVVPRGNALIARIVLNYEELRDYVGRAASSAAEAAGAGVTELTDVARKILEEIRTTVNRQVSSFARISEVIEQPEPFEKTPTLKIKRFLYQ